MCCLFDQLHPIISDHKYLVEQHLLLAVKSVDNDESYGKYSYTVKKYSRH